MKNIDKFKLVAILIISLPILNCTELSGQTKKLKSPGSKEFKEYWYSGKAELNRYHLEQVRYGEIHEGDAVLIFVTEDFDTRDQVKYERGSKEHVASVMKLNFTRKFFTGIYPYSMMSSIFTPVDTKKPTMKVTTSSQEWCGHTFSQVNLENDRYRGKLYSYFQEEGDSDFTVDKVILEDALWNLIRLDPSKLPVGTVDILPGTMFLRLKHHKPVAEEAEISLESLTDPSLSPNALQKYRIDYKNLSRVVEITFETEFPHSIVQWEEQSQEGRAGSNILTTKAVRTHSMNSAYWGQHDVADSHLREKLGLGKGN